MVSLDDVESLLMDPGVGIPASVSVIVGGARWLEVVLASRSGGGDCCCHCRVGCGEEALACCFSDFRFTDSLSS